MSTVSLSRLLSFFVLFPFPLYAISVARSRSRSLNSYADSVYTANTARRGPTIGFAFLLLSFCLIDVSHTRSPNDAIRIKYHVA